MSTFKSALIDIRFSRESGTNERGIYEHGSTYNSRYQHTITPHTSVPLTHSASQLYARMEIGGLDDYAEVFINTRFAYAFLLNGKVDEEYSVVRFYFDGFWYILEYRILSRENS